MLHGQAKLCGLKCQGMRGGQQRQPRRRGMACAIAQACHSALSVSIGSGTRCKQRLIPLCCDTMAVVAL
jgi:hypothetical protein